MGANCKQSGLFFTKNAACKGGTDHFVLRCEAEVRIQQGVITIADPDGIL